jgi:hypothetical protein
VALTLLETGVDVVCDGCGQTSTMIGLVPGGVAEALKMFSRLGWKESDTPAPKGSKRWLGPCCSAKKARAS